MAKQMVNKSNKEYKTSEQERMYAKDYYQAHKEQIKINADRGFSNLSSELQLAEMQSFTARYLQQLRATQ